MITELYRYRGEGDHSYMRLKLVLDVFPVLKTTPGGYWIGISSVCYIKGQVNLKDKKWVSNDQSFTAKKFAFETEERALVNFLARKDKQLRLLRQQKSQAKAERELVLAEISNRKINLPPRLKRKYHDVVI